jgi:hypothetical protein
LAGDVDVGHGDVDVGGEDDDEIRGEQPSQGGPMPGRAHERDTEGDFDGAAEVDERFPGRDPVRQVLHEGFDPREVGDAGDDHRCGESSAGVVTPPARAAAEEPSEGGGGEEDG